MRIALAIASLFLFGCKVAATDATKATATPTPTPVPVVCNALDGGLQQVNGSDVSVTGSDDRNDYPVVRTLDGNNTTFMTTNTLSMNSVVYLYYEFLTPIDIARFDVVDNYTDQYSLGDLQVQTSTDSTNSVNGTWTTAATVNSGNHGFTLGDGSITVNSCAVKWLRLKMTYTGSGAYGGSPAFYLSEINFFKEL